MRKKGKSNSISSALRFVVGLTTSIFVLSAGAVLNAGGFSSHQGRFWKGNPPACGNTITIDTSLFTDLDCSGHSGAAALTLQEGATLKMNGRKIIGNSGINCIEINYNRAGCNSGCVGTDDFPCSARERDFWDENVDQDANSVSTNRWLNNRIECADAQPEYSPNPEPDD